MPEPYMCSNLIKTAATVPKTQLVIVCLNSSLHKVVAHQVELTEAPNVSVIGVHGREGADAGIPPNIVDFEDILPEGSIYKFSEDYCKAKAAYIQTRPHALNRIFSAVREFYKETKFHRTVFLFAGALGTCLESVFLTELPVDVATRYFWETRSVPLCLRFTAIPKDEGTEHTANFFQLLADYYFDLPPFDEAFVQYYPRVIYGNPFDSVVAIPLGHIKSEFFPFLKSVLNLQKLEAESLCRSQTMRFEKTMTIDHVMALDNLKRRLDWTSLCYTAYFPRLFEEPIVRLYEVLDFRKVKERAGDVWAHLKGLNRENDWDHNQTVDRLTSAYSSLPAHQKIWAGPDFPSRITPGDKETEKALKPMIDESTEQIDV